MLIQNTALSRRSFLTFFVRRKKRKEKDLYIFQLWYWKFIQGISTWINAAEQHFSQSEDWCQPTIKITKKTPNSTVPATMNVKQKDVQMIQRQRKNHSSIHKKWTVLRKSPWNETQRGQIFVLSSYFWSGRNPNILVERIQQKTIPRKQAASPETPVQELHTKAWRGHTGS